MPNVRLPLFPLNVVLLPGADLPLHIFEPRYRQMVRECLDTQTPFGMLLALPNGIAGIGCTAEILEVTKRYPDGRSDILAIGRTPFRVVELFDNEALLRGEVDFLEDRPSPRNPRVCRELNELYETCHTLVFGDCPGELCSSPEEDISYIVAARLPMELLWKQRVLELRSEAERQERLVAYLREWAPHLEKTTQLRVQAASGLN
ncbi:MAG TPA: LON peptidase substrate-binding domain-containing protein [Candidatus Acidoferrum sp.]|nr:LON peptidase substrate-binding domain-containing protein [Candidatus Acidoferrum sp.]